MGNKKYLTTGITEVLTLLGVYRKEAKSYAKKLKQEQRQAKTERETALSEKRLMVSQLKEAEGRARQAEISVDLMRKVILRAHKGLSEEPEVNTEGLKRKDVREILAETLKAFELIGSAKPELLKSKEELADFTQQVLLLAAASGEELPAAADALTFSAEAHTGATLPALMLGVSPSVAVNGGTAMIRIWGG